MEYQPSEQENFNISTNCFIRPPFYETVNNKSCMYFNLRCLKATN